jgi:hypothetical protein
MPSAPWSTRRRVEEWTTCPGTVKTFTRRLMLPASVSALKTSGSMSKKSVRSSFVSSVIRRPRLASRTSSWSALRFVVLPLSAGP